MKATGFASNTSTDDAGASSSGSGSGEIEMGLYSCRMVERVLRQLQAANRLPDLSAGERIALPHLFEFDQLHYCGTEALDKAIALLGLGKGCRVLDVGCGLGGPARYLAWRAEAHVTGVELQPRMKAAALALTQLTDLKDSELLRFVEGDFTKLGLTDLSGCNTPFDSLISYLCFLHIPNKEALFQKCFDALRPGGTMLIEDFYLKQPASLVTSNIKAKLVGMVACAWPILDRPSYEQHLRSAGFQVVNFEELTDEWAPFVKQRAESFRRGKAQLPSSPAEELDEEGKEALQLDAFYHTVSELFNDPKQEVGGARIHCVKPPVLSPSAPSPTLHAV
ncbi:Class I SAM-dependent methyltransferase [Balamuthia mandrillaris]